MNDVPAAEQSSTTLVTTPSSASSPVLTHSVADARAAVRRLRERGLSIALVPTMGALHAGHLSLVELARTQADVVVVSIFVNPVQFGPTEDLAAYPRTLDDDVRLLAGSAAVVFAPSAEEMYPDGWPQTLVTPGEIATRYEGALRPGHFAGVLTVISKLFHIVQPDIAVFGEKDAQQLAVVRRMVADLDVPVRIVGAPIRRDTDGIALSSRNRYLSESERATALFLSRAITAVAEQARDGVHPSAARAVGISLLEAQAGIEIDYLDIVDESTFTAVDDDFTGDARVIVAARVGTTRLIDNTPAHFGTGTEETA